MARGVAAGRAASLLSTRQGRNCIRGSEVLFLLQEVNLFKY
jgi:hypothetical protein